MALSCLGLDQDNYVVLLPTCALPAELCLIQQYPGLREFAFWWANILWILWISGQVLGRTSHARPGPCSAAAAAGGAPGLSGGPLPCHAAAAALTVPCAPPGRAPAEIRASLISQAFV